MEALVDTIVDFVRVRQLNIAVAALLTIVYLVYQYWGYFVKAEVDEYDCRHGGRLSRSRSRSRSCSKSRTRSRSGNYEYKLGDSKHGRRGRKAHRRCLDCSLCNLDQ